MDNRGKIVIKNKNNKQSKKILSSIYFQMQHNLITRVRIIKELKSTIKNKIAPIIAIAKDFKTPLVIYNHKFYFLV